MIKIIFTIAAFLLAPVVSSFALITIYVDGGNFGAPYYKFYSDSGLTQQLDIYTGGSDSLLIGQDYTFIKSATSHPFYLSDLGYGQTSSSLISLVGDGSATSGIGSGESITLSFNGFDPSVTTLTYYCTVHSVMVGTLQVIPEPSTYALFGGGLALAVVMLRRRFRR